MGRDQRTSPFGYLFLQCAASARRGYAADTYSFGKALGSTDGTGREVRFSFTTAISPEWGYMDDKAVVRPGFTENYYRFSCGRG